MSSHTDETPAVYIRRRAYNKIHVRSWLIYLEKDGFVRCSFKNCNFMAFNVEEMRNHYGFCKGSGSTANFVCTICDGRTDSLEKLEHHQALTHNITSSATSSIKSELNVSTTEENQKVRDNAGNLIRIAGQGGSQKPSRVLQIAWAYSLERNNCIKCSECNFLACSLTEMMQHFTVCKEEMDSLLYVCPICKGRTYNVYPLIWHLERSHKITKPPGDFNTLTKKMLQYWKSELNTKVFAPCLHSFNGQIDCFYFDTDFLGIIEHSQTCKGPQLETQKKQCPMCPKWSKSADNVLLHVSKEHSQKSAQSKEEIAVHKLPSPIQNLQIVSISKEKNESLESPSLVNNNKTIIKYEIICDSDSRGQSKNHEVVEILSMSEHNQKAINQEKVTMPIGFTTNITKDTDQCLTMDDGDDFLLDGMQNDSNESNHNVNENSNDSNGSNHNVNEDLQVRIDKQNKVSENKETCKTIDNVIIDESQCETKTVDCNRPQKSSLHSRNEIVKNNYGVGSYTYSSKEKLLPIQQLNKANFEIDSDLKEKGNVFYELIEVSSNEKNIFEDRNQSMFIDNPNESLDICKVEVPNKNKSPRKTYKQYIHNSLLFKDESSSDEYDDSYEDDVVEEENVTIPNARSTICIPQELGFCKPVKHYLMKPGINMDRHCNENSSSEFDSKSNNGTLQYTESFDNGCQTQESMFVEKMTTTQNKYPILKTYQKVDQVTFENCAKKIIVSPEEISKSSEKNDKLMSHVNIQKSNFKYDSKQNNHLKTVQNSLIHVTESKLNLKSVHTLSSPSSNVVSEVSLQKSMLTNMYETTESNFESKSTDSTLSNSDKDSSNEKTALEAYSQPKEPKITIEGSSVSGCRNEILNQNQERVQLPEFTSCEQTSQTSKLSSVIISTPKKYLTERKKMVQNTKTQKRTYSSRSQLKVLEKAVTFQITETLSINSNQDRRSYSKDNLDHKTLEVNEIRSETEESSDMDLSFMHQGRITKELSNQESASKEVFNKTVMKIADKKPLPDLSADLLKSKEEKLKNLRSEGNFEEDSLGEEFICTNEELDLSNDAFSGFQEVSDKNHSYKEQFNGFLKRLSESENELCNNTNEISEGEESHYQSSNVTFSLDGQTDPSKINKDCNNIHNISINIEIQDVESSKKSSDPNYKSENSKDTTINDIDEDSSINYCEKLGFDHINSGNKNPKETIKQDLLQKRQRLIHENHDFEKNTETEHSPNIEDRNDKFALTLNETNASYLKKFTSSKSKKKNLESVNNNEFKQMVKEKNDVYKESKDDSCKKILVNQMEIIKQVDNNLGCEMKYNTMINEKLSSLFSDKDSVSSSLDEGSNQTSQETTCINKDIVLNTVPNSSFNDSTLAIQQGKKSIENPQSNSFTLKNARLQTKTKKEKTFKTGKPKMISRKNENEPKNLTSGLLCHSPIKNKSMNSFTENLSGVSCVETRQENTTLLCSGQPTDVQPKNQTEKKLGSKIVDSCEEIPLKNNALPKREGKLKLQNSNVKDHVEKNENITLHVNKLKDQQLSQKRDEEKLNVFVSPTEKLEVVDKQENLQDISHVENLNSSNVTIPVLVHCEREIYSKKQDTIDKDLLKFGNIEKNNLIHKDSHYTNQEVLKNTAISGISNNEESSPSTLPVQTSSSSGPPKKRGRPPKVKFNSTVNEDSFIEVEMENTPKTADNNCMETKTISNPCKKKDLSPLALPKQEICNPNPLIKRRGRPPKIKLNSTVNEDSINLGVMENTPKTATDNCIETKTISKTCNKRNLSPSTLPTQEVCNPNPLIKRRGRPPKIKLNSTENEDSFNFEVMENTPKTATDNCIETKTISKTCNKRNLSPSTLPMQEVCNPNPLIKRRGRPPKIKLNSTVNEDSFNLGVMENTPKTATDNCIETKTILNPCTKKCTSPSTLPMQEVYNPNPLTKRRGRPPKGKLTENEQKIKKNDDLDISMKTSKNDNSTENKRSLERKGNQTTNKLTQFEENAKSLTDSFNTQLCDSRNTELKRKRGRPFKTKISFKKVEMSDSDGSVPLSKRIKISHKSNNILYNKKQIKCDVEPINSITTVKNVHQETKTLSRRVITARIVFDECSDEESLQSEEPVEKRICISKPKRRGRNFKYGSQLYFSQSRTLKDKVTCGVCKQEMIYKQYENHAIFKHYLLCWIEGDPPMDMNDDREVVNRLWYAKKHLGKTPYRCFNCNLPKLSAVGFQSHIRFCGKECEEKDALMVSCELCGAKMMPSSLTPHMYVKHNKESVTTRVDSTVIIPKSKRAAASRAKEVILSHTKEDGDESDSSRPGSPDSTQKMLKLYLRPTKVIPPKVYKTMKTALQETNIATCPYQGCDFTCDSMIAFRKHYLSCQFGPSKPFKCRKCEFTTQVEQEIQNHILSKHEKVLCDDHVSEYESSEESDEDNSGSAKGVHYSHLPFKFLKSKIKPTSKVGKTLKRNVFCESLVWTLELKKKIFVDDVLYNEDQPSLNNWKPLHPDAVSQYLPLSEKSAKFRGRDGTWHALRRFEATLLDGIPLIFTGGPVWSLAWAPVTDLEVTQYLAVASHPNMDVTHEMASVYNYKSIIQIWSFGHLSNLEQTSGQTPKFMMGIAHSRGAVWALQWCPSGCYQDNRLGLLAAACSDGSIPIYSIPKHRQLFEHTIYDVQPVMELKLGSEELSQCTSLDWHSVAPHNLVIAGFANGVVALWDLSSTSPLLKQGLTIFPFKIIEAHLASVTGVSLSPSLEDTLVMTASLDRATKFWQLEDTTAPVNTLRKASVLSAVMPLNWLTSINAYDEIFSMNLTHVTGYNYREAFNSNNFNHLFQDSSVWSVSFNDWINACVCASTVGKLTVFLRHQILVPEDLKKAIRNSWNSDMVTCLLKPLNNSSIPEELGQSFSEIVDAVGIEIIFHEKISERSRSKVTSTSHDNITYPLASINKVSWNPNYQSFTWLAAGMQSGLVVTPRFQSFPTQELLRFYNS